MAWIGGNESMDDKDFNNIYNIPANYTDSGKLLGGMLEPRNTVETCILLFLLGYPQVVWLQAPFMVKIVIMTVTLLPAGIVGLMGIGGDSLVQFFKHMITFWLRRRKLHLRRIGYRYEQTETTNGQRPKARSKTGAAKFRS